MSLNVSEKLMHQAVVGTVEEQDFAVTVRQSLPYAWGVVETLVQQLRDGEEWADHSVPPPDEQARGQLLRMVGGDAIRGAVERHFNIKLAFQNCHTLAAFHRDAVDSEAYRNFTSVRSQILNQTPELVDC